MKVSIIRLLLLSTLVLGLLLAVPIFSQTAHGANVGIVCIAASGANKCPANSPILTGPVPPTTTQVRVAVVLNQSDSINGFDITLRADHTIVKPAAADRAGSVLQGTITPISECVGLVAIIGSCSSTDTVDTLHLVVSASGTTFFPTTGLLFTAVYNITGSTVRTPLDFQSGCTSTSVSGGICVTLSNGTPNPASATVQSASFSNLPYFSISFSSSTLTIARGAAGNSVINVTSLNGFTGNVNLAATISPSGASSPSLTVAPPTIVVPAGGSGLSLVTVSMGTQSAGNYNVTVTATSNALSNSGTILIIGPDFSMIVNPSPLVENATSVRISTITISSIRQYNGTITLTASPQPGLTATLSGTTLSLPQAGQIVANLTTRASVEGSYNVTITATSGRLFHSSILTVNAVGFSLTARPNQVQMVQGNRVNATVFASGGQNAPFFQGNVSISASVTLVLSSGTSTTPSSGLTVTCAPSSLLLTPSNGFKASTICTITAVRGGNYTVSIIGTFANNASLSHAITVVVTVLGPSFGFVTSSNVQTVSVGSTLTTTFNLTRLVNFNGTVTLSTQVSTSGPTAKLNATQVSLSSQTIRAPILLTLSANSTVTPGTYSLRITGTNGTIAQSILLTIVVITTVSPHDVAIYSVTVTPVSAVAGTTVTFTILVQNLGKVQEQVIVAALVGDQTVGQQNATIAAGGNQTITIMWDTAGFPTGPYVPGAKVLQVSGETNLANNQQRAAAALDLTPQSNGILSSNLLLPLVLIAVVIVAALLLFAFRPWKRKVTTA